MDAKIKGKHGEGPVLMVDYRVGLTDHLRIVGAVSTMCGLPVAKDVRAVEWCEDWHELPQCGECKAQLVDLLRDWGLASLDHVWW